MRQYEKQLIWLHTEKVLQIMWMTAICPRYIELFTSINDDRTYHRIYGLLNHCNFDQYKSCNSDFLDFILSLIGDHTNLPPRSRVNNHKRVTRHCFRIKVTMKKRLKKGWIQMWATKKVFKRCAGHVMIMWLVENIFVIWYTLSIWKSWKNMLSLTP